MNIPINFDKVFRFILMLAMIAGGLVALGSIYAAYIIDQQAKIERYDRALNACLLIPGAVINYEVSTPAFGAGLDMSCEWVEPNFRRL